MSSPDIIIAPEPFTPRVERLELPALGQNLAAILAAACNQGGLAVDDLERVRVYVNGVAIADEAPDWLDYVPAAGDVVNITVEPLGGGGQGDGNKVLQTVLTIALVAVSFWIGGPAGPLATSHVLLRTVAAAAVNIGGQALLSAVFKPPGPEAAEEANARGALMGSTNQFRLRGPFPLALGRGRYAFDLAAGPYTQTEGEDVWLVVMFGLHYGPTTLEDVKIGETLLADWPAEDIKVETFLAPGPRASALYPGRVVQENFNDELEDGGEPDVHTTATDAERIELDFVFPGGLSYTNEKGKFLEAGAHFLVEVQPAGGGAWTPADLPPAVAPSGALPPGSVYIQRASRDPVRAMASFEPPEKGQWNVRVTYAAGFEGEGTLANNAYWTALRTMEAEAPVLDEELSLLVLKIKSSGDLNGNLPTVSGVLEPIVPVWNGADWETSAPSSNAAALARWLVTGPPAARPLAEASIDASIEEAYELVEANDWTGCVDLREEMSQRDALILLGKMGRFSTYWNGRALCFVTDWEKAAPRQMFTGRNAAGYRYRRAFPDPIHAVIVEYATTDSTAPASELFVYADGFDETTAHLFETYRLDFACTPERAFREGRAYLAKRLLQVEVHEWQAGLDSVATTYGARVLVRHMATLYGLAEATVDNRIWAGALVAGVRLDEAVILEAGKDYGLDIRRADGVIRGVPVINPGDGEPTRTLTFAAPRAEDLAPEPGDLVVFGELGTITEDLEIVDVEASADGTATFRGMLYIADALEAAETGPIPPLGSPVAPRQAAPVPRIIGANGSPDGVVVTFDVDPVRSALLAGFKVRMRRTAVEGNVNPWAPLADLGAADRFVRTPPISDAASPPDGDVLAEYRVDVEVRSVLRSGAISEPGKAYGVLVRRGVPAPLLFAAEGLAIEGPDGSKYPAIVVTAQEMEAGQLQDLNVEIRHHNGGDTWRPAGPPLPAAKPRGELLDVDAGQSYDVRGRWRSSDNWFGPWATVSDVLVPAGSRVSYASLTVGGLTPEELEDALQEAANIGGALTARLRELAEASLYHSVRIDEDIRYVDHLAHLDGREIGALLVEERIVREEADLVSARILDLLGAVMGDFEAFALNELLVEVRPGQSLASWRTALEAADADSVALYDQEVIARTAADETFARYFSFLGAERGDLSGWNLAEGEVFLGSGQTFATYRTQTATSIGDAFAAISNEESARISADASLVSSISTLELNVAGFSGSITTLQSITQGLGAEWTLAVQVGQLVTGIRNYNTGLTGSLLFFAPEIGFSNGVTAVYPLSIVGNVVRAQNFEVDRVTAGSIVTASIQAGNITDTTIANVATGAQIFDGATFLGSMNFSSVGPVSISIKGNISTTDSIGVAIKYEIHGGAGLVYASPEWGDYIFAGQMGGLNTVSLDEYISIAPGSYSILVYGRRGGGGGTLINNRLLVTVTDFKTEQ